MFLNRQAELEKLREIFSKRSSQLVIIYGRRRVGKSLLIKYFASQNNIRHIYYSGTKATKNVQIYHFLKICAQVLGEAHLDQVTVPGWLEAFNLIAPYLKQKKTILTLDEFPWIMEKSPEIESEIHSFWEQHKNRSEGFVYIILCGSQLSMMKRLADQTHPLHGRKTASFFLKPFSHQEAQLFQEGFGLKDRAIVYGICGGIPQYHEIFSRKRHLSVEQIIREECFKSHGDLVPEGEFLILNEFKNSTYAFSILEVLSHGNKRLGEIAKGTGIDIKDLSHHIQNLVQLGYVKKLKPIYSKVEERKTLYCICDPFLFFWFRYVYPYKTLIDIHTPQEIYHLAIQPSWSQYLGLAFESLVYQAVPALFRKEGFVVKTMGTYWKQGTAAQPGVQIDLVVERMDGEVHICECKWESKPAGVAVYQELVRKITLYPYRDKTLNPTLFCLVTPSRELKELKKSGKLWIYTLEDIYK